jgi:hypothetical protein
VTFKYDNFKYILSLKTVVSLKTTCMSHCNSSQSIICLCQSSLYFAFIPEMTQTSQSEPDCGSVKSQAFIYDKENCRLCQCLKGTLQCEVKPKKCRNDQIDNMCSFINGEFFVEGTAHFDGCNHCVCRKRE